MFEGQEGGPCAPEERVAEVRDEVRTVRGLVWGTYIVSVKTLVFTVCEM